MMVFLVNGGPANIKYELYGLTRTGKVGLYPLSEDSFRYNSQCRGKDILIFMERKYFTKKGTVYIQRIKRGKEFWIKQDTNGQTHQLMGGIHISRQKLKELIREYPSSLLDKTYCFDADVEREFFEDAKREKFTGSIESEQTVIFSLIKRESNRYGIGCSSLVERIKETD